MKKGNEARERLDKLEKEKDDLQMELDCVKTENAELNVKLIEISDRLDDQLQSVQASAGGMVPLCEQATTVMVNPVKLAYCQSDDWSKCARMLVTCVFSVSEKMSLR